MIQGYRDFFCLVTDILSTSAEVKKIRISLEEKTEKAFEAFAQGKQRVRELAHLHNS